MKNYKWNFVRDSYLTYDVYYCYTNYDGKQLVVFQTEKKQTIYNNINGNNNNK